MMDDGTRINVWMDPWIRDSPHFKPTTPIIAGLEDLKVAALCSHDLHCWNADLLRPLLNDHDV